MFYCCTSLTSITIPDSVTSIGDCAFSHCTSLTRITIPNSVTSIEYSAFSDCTSLTSIIIPDGVTSIGSYAFSDCTSLAGITIPKSVTSIGGNTFRGCTSLTSITITDSVTSIGNYAFYDCELLTVHTNNQYVIDYCEKNYIPYDTNIQSSIQSSYSDKWERKARYVDRLMRKNAEVETLTEEQHDALAELASIRHKIHSNWDSMWNAESSEYNQLWDYIDSGINDILSEVDLPTIDFDYSEEDIPTSFDYDLLTDEEQAEYDYDSWLWREESGEYEIFAEYLTEVNDKIENYLADIDREHGTQYAPTGWARMDY